MTNDLDKQRASAAAQHFSIAVAHFKAGRHQLALQLAEQLIPIYPGNTQLLSLAAACARELSSPEKAEIYLRALISVQPGMVEAHNDLGMLLKDSGRHAEAKATFDKALEINPQLVPAHVNLGNLLQRMGQTGKAEAAYRNAIAIQPSHASALYNLGLLLAEQGREPEAEALLRQSLVQDPDQADVYVSLGKLLAEAHRDAEAEAAFAAATRLKPKFADAHFNLAVLLCDARRYQEALVALRHALEAEPSHANALNCFGNVMSALGRQDKAEMAYRRALEIRPDSANIHNNLGNLWMEDCKLAAAEEEFRRAFALESDYGYALGQAVSCAHRCYSWAHFQADSEAILAAIDKGVEGIPALMVQALPTATPAQLMKAGALNSLQKIRSILEQPPIVQTSRHPDHDRLRIGYLSQDFREHAVMHLAAGVFEKHDRYRFAVHAYALSSNSQDKYRQRIEQACESFRDVSQSSASTIAEQIAADGIDILVDLGGYTIGARPEVTAMRPAPLIVNWLGYPGSLGQPRLADYLIGDAVLTPLEHQAHYSETLALMPDCYLPHDDKLTASATPERGDVGLPKDALVFCSFNQSYKLNPETFSIWCKLLAEVPGSVLWLLQPKDASATDNLRREARARHIAPERLIFAPAMPLSEHLGRLSLADLALDTFPYGSGATGNNALNAAVPLITRQGSSYVSRMAASQLHAAGLPELVTNNWDEYFNLAKTLALDTDKRTALRDKLARNRATASLFDTQRFTRDLEALYMRMWSDHASGLRAPISLIHSKA